MFTPIWTDDNIAHIVEHGITPEEVTDVLAHPQRVDVSRSSGRPIAFGRTRAGRDIVVVFDEIEADLVYPITAYEVEP